MCAGFRQVFNFFGGAGQQGIPPPTIPSLGKTIDLAVGVVWLRLEKDLQLGFAVMLPTGVGRLGLEN